MPLGPTRSESRIVNQPPPAPMSATLAPSAISSESMTRCGCCHSSRPAASRRPSCSGGKRRAWVSRCCALTGSVPREKRLPPAPPRFQRRPRPGTRAWLSLSLRAFQQAFQNHREVSGRVVEMVVNNLAAVGYECFEVPQGLRLLQRAERVIGMPGTGVASHRPPSAGRTRRCSVRPCETDRWNADIADRRRRSWRVRTAGGLSAQTD